MSACMFWKLLLRAIALLTFGYAGENGVLEAVIGFMFGMGGCLYTIKEIFFREAGNVTGEFSQAISLQVRQLRSHRVF